MAELERAPIYPALLLQPTLMGLPQRAWFVMLFLSGLVAIAAQMQIYVLAGIAVFWLMCLPFLRRAFEREPFLLEILQQYYSIPSKLPSHGEEGVTPFVQPVGKPWEG